MILERQAGPALYTSHHWLWNEPLRLLAITGYRATTEPDKAREVLKQQEEWMIKLGTTLKTA